MKIAIVNDMPMAIEALRRALAFEPAHQIIWVASMVPTPCSVASSRPRI